VMLVADNCLTRGVFGKLARYQQLLKGYSSLVSTVFSKIILLIVPDKKNLLISGLIGFTDTSCKV
jgi:hypothetical protein